MQEIEQKPYRIIVTGWRSWPRRQAYVIWEFLVAEVMKASSESQYRETVIIEGACPTGVDDYAYRWALGIDGVRSERYPANWQEGKSAGPKRNASMISYGADICLAFPGPNSRGTLDCVKKAINAGIQTIVTPYNENGNYAIR